MWDDQVDTVIIGQTQNHKNHCRKLMWKSHKYENTHTHTSKLSYRVKLKEFFFHYRRYQNDRGIDESKREDNKHVYKNVTVQTTV